MPTPLIATIIDRSQLVSANRKDALMSAPWIKSYPKGVRWDAELETMPLAQILERSATKWRANPALDFMNRKFSYRELSDLTNRAAKGFQKLGVRPGVHVGLYLPNTPHYIIALGAGMPNAYHDRRIKVCYQGDALPLLMALRWAEAAMRSSLSSEGA